MKNENLRFGSIKEMLTKDQMKKIKGGVAFYRCCQPWATGGENCGLCIQGPPSCSGGQSAIAC